MLISAKNHRVKELQKVDENQPHAFKIKGKNRFSLGAQKVSLTELIGPICKGDIIHIPSMGNWSLVDMIEYIIEQIGSSEVHLTSWAVSEKSVVTLLNLRNQGLISSLHCLFDTRLPSQSTAAWQLCDANIESLKLTKIHAKVVALKSETHAVCIVTTANLTENPRIERYVITESDSLYEYEMDWIIRSINNAKPFKA